MELERYLRNQNAISPQEQALLSQKRIVIIGCGGLGGYLLEQLGRLGVGRSFALSILTSLKRAI